MPEVVGGGQGGLLDVAIDPEFAENRLVYLSYAEPGGRRRRHRGGARHGSASDGLEDVQVI